MKVIHINKSDSTGGAAVAAHRLVMAQRSLGIEAGMLVEEKRRDDTFVFRRSDAKFAEFEALAHFLAERLYFLPHEKNAEIRFAFSPAWAGFALHKHTQVAQSSIVHLHWFNQGFMRMSSLKQLLLSGKKIVWTLHDMWAFTGGCHYAGDCKGFAKHCGHCPMLKKPSEHDLSAKVYALKEFIKNTDQITFVTCSKWLAGIAATSSLLQNKRIVAIPNAIDTWHFAPRNTELVRAKFSIPSGVRVVLFGAANIDDSRKGFPFVLDALARMKASNPDRPLWLLLFGKVSEATLSRIPIPHRHIPFINVDALPDVYSAADLMFLPSLQDNLPNTVMEALSCGTPVVAFRTGGVPEMIIDGLNGYVVPQHDTAAMADQALKILAVENTVDLRSNCRHFAVENYAPEVVAKQYLAIYNDLLKEK